MASRNLTCQTVLDSSAINTLREMGSGQNEKFIHEFIDLYLRNSAVSIHQILDCAESGESVALRAAAHKLRGASLYVGGLQVAELCKGLEKKVKKKDLAGVEELVGSLEAAYEALCGALETVREEKDPVD